MKTLISTLLVKLFIKKSKILRNQKLGEKFALLTIAFPKKRVWTPGDKVQIKISSNAMRSYTPIDFIDEKIFTTLIYLPKKGPGTIWADKAKISEKLEIFGPRPSLSLQKDKEYVFFGDETSIGLYIALKNHFKVLDYLFEVHAKNEVEDVINFYELNQDKFHESKIYDSKKNLANLLAKYEDSIIILSGNKNSINTLTTLLNEMGRKQLISRPYWGKR